MPKTDAPAALTPTTIYLAGGRSQDWRDRVRDWADALEGVKTIDPFNDFHIKQDSIADFTHGDLQAIARSHVVLGYCDYHRYTGMALEFGFAYAKGIPIIYVPTLPRIDSMMAGVSSAMFTELGEALAFIEDRYL